MQSKTYTSLEEHAQVAATFDTTCGSTTFLQKTTGKQRSIPANTWFDRECQEAWRDYHNR